MFNKMQSKDLLVTIVMPARNEEKNIASAIDDTISTFKDFGLRGEIVVVDDGSTDSTSLLVKRRMEENPGLIRMINHSNSQGIGASFRDGVKEARGDIVCMLPADNENDPQEILRYVELFDHVDVVVPFVINKNVRLKWRILLSFIYRGIINSTFQTSLNYTNGTVLYRKSLLNELDNIRRGFFYQTDILIRLVKRGYLFAEVPYRLRERKQGKSKAITLSALREVVGGYLRLVKDIYFKRKTKGFASDSLSAKRCKIL
ncbi:MAG: glycosyltransferase family 2 protein [Candidatus Omnitrophica bacterium]|nr:glycosyltransferase family 2 protein [Candidatus Omnitrophota bacterium]MBU0896372.1 glycosyltransferase family 2 protein [Candidatus Omnitrophota bacterium]MBU1134303.1 glycosyltransferase family 2 protein [Candidatus Omnitrophota bacterium]MBU1367054.1 glycosyltransferase family 2 protein [Candidatus Omnitrophota bacterium]MBU2436483.1 glycosyltransferase family 2 protein [Candidatus Omnitrophota bacterium]